MRLIAIIHRIPINDDFSFLRHNPMRAPTAVR
jgi:hypothetical protein